MWFNNSLVLLDGEVDLRG